MLCFSITVLFHYSILLLAHLYVDWWFACQRRAAGQRKTNHCWLPISSQTTPFPTSRKITSSQRGMALVNWHGTNEEQVTFLPTAAEEHALDDGWDEERMKHSETYLLWSRRHHLTHAVCLCLVFSSSLHGISCRLFCHWCLHWWSIH